MSYPIKYNYKAGEGPCVISASDLNAIAQMLNPTGLSIEMIAGLEKPEINWPDGSGNGWSIRIPCSVIPTLPTSGDYVLTSQDGVLSWVELSTFECPE